MSVLRPALEDVSAGSSRAAMRQPSATAVVPAAALLMILIVLVADAALRGPWLDEFWTLELSDTRQGWSALVRDGWLRDTHPAAFNLWATFLSSLGITSIPMARLATNLPAAALMIWATLQFSRRLPDHAGYYVAMLLLTLSLPQAIEAFANYRSYFWQIACLASLAGVGRYLAATQDDLDLRRDLPLMVIAVLATAGAMALHYVGAVFGGLLAGAIFLGALARGHRRWAMLVLVTAAAAFLEVVAVALLQAGNWSVDLDISWIEADSLAAVLAVPVGLVMVALWHNPVPLLALWPGWRAPRRRERAAERTFVAMIAAVLVAGVAVVIAIDAVRPIVVDRYLVAVPVLISAIMASLAARFARDGLLMGLLALMAAGVAVGSFLLHGATPRWDEGARTIARLVEACPTTKVYAASGWSVGPNAETRAARREDPVFRRAYEHLAGKHGYDVRFLGQNETTWVNRGSCPVLAWFEHTPNDAEDDPHAALAMSGVWGLEEARLQAIRSPTGFVVRADPPVGRARGAEPLTSALPHDRHQRGDQ